MHDSFPQAEWIWTPETAPNQYALFVRNVTLPEAVSTLRVRVAAAHHYELFLNGAFVSRGPVHTDPRWCQYDVLEWTPRHAGRELCITILVHHSPDIYLHYLLQSPGGLVADFSDREGNLLLGTDAAWKCLTLETWSQEAPKKNPSLDHLEDYDARREPEGWPRKLFPDQAIADWAPAVPVPDAGGIWSNTTERMTPPLRRTLIAPRTFRAWRATGPGAAKMGEVSTYCDEEALQPVGRETGYSPEAVNAVLPEANAFTIDLGREHIGFYTFELEAPEGVVLEVSGAELLRDGRPWIFRKGTSYSMRYRTREGRQRFTSFTWNGFRYMHVVVRGDAARIRFSAIGCLERKAETPALARPELNDPELQRILDLCRRTLEIGVQEHLIDCPTREQTQYWGDAIFIAQSFARGAGEYRYLSWYLECFLHVPFRENGQISCTYPGNHPAALLDYSMIPLIGQRFYREHHGKFRKPAETLEKALQLKRWYDAHIDADGLVSFDYEAYARKGLRTFIDHPGIGWHDFPHPGIDRHGVSCPLNIFHCGFVDILGDIARETGSQKAELFKHEAAALRETIRNLFYDGTVFRDARRNGRNSIHASWQTNALAVYFGLIEGADATNAMRAMLKGYDHLCRCSPYFHFYFLPALRKAGLEQEAVDLIKSEWGAMLRRDATAAWETFSGDAKDSLCHPWSTAPYLFILEQSGAPGADAP